MREYVEQTILVRMERFVCMGRTRDGHKCGRSVIGERPRPDHRAGESMQYQADTDGKWDGLPPVLHVWQPKGWQRVYSETPADDDYFCPDCYARGVKEMRGG